MFRIFTNFGPASDLPDVANVLNDDTVGGSAGTFVNIAEANVSLNEQWGAGGTEFTGSGIALGADSIFFLRRR